LNDEEIGPSYPELPSRLQSFVKHRNTLAHSALIHQSEAWVSDGHGWTLGGLTRRGYERQSFTIEELRGLVDDAIDLQGGVWDLWERVAGHKMPDSTC
jgi:hypothetical protein